MLGPDPAARDADQVDTTLFRALAVLRVVVLVFALLLNAVRWPDFAHPVAGWLVVTVMVVWTAFATWAYDAPRRRRPPLLVADLAVTVAAILSTPYVQGQAMVERNAPTVPSFWVMAAMLAWAVWRGWPAGLVAAAVLAGADLSVRSTPTGTTWANIFLLLLGAGIVGYSASLLRQAVELRAAAERRTATLEERARLARAVHDGVLQVLALVQRRGAELGGEAAVLGRLAGEQEVALRALVQGAGGSWAEATSDGSPGSTDVAAALAALQSGTVTVSGPGAPVPLPEPVAAELTAAVRACLDNVARHVGADAHAWVLVEDLGRSVAVTVRDAGPGIPEGRLEQARADGRLGVSESVRGRLAQLGGTAALVTAPGLGTEWELTVPRG